MVRAVQTSCILCSLGCRFIIESRMNEAAALGYDRGDAVFGGKLCSKGNYTLELINHPFRLIEPKMEGKAVSWPDALDRLARELSTAKGVGVIIGGDVSVEDAALAVGFAGTCLPHSRIGVYFPAGDDRVYRALADAGVAGRTPSIGDIERSACTVAVGDPFEIGPVIAGPVLKGKRARRSNILAVISNGRTRTSRFATVHFSGPERSTLAGLLRCIADESGSDGPGWMRAVRDHMPAPHDAAVVNLAAAFTKTPSSVMILETQDPVTASLAALVVRAAGGERKLLPILSYANTAGIRPVIKDTETVEAILDAALRGEVDALLVLGADPARGGTGADMRPALESVRFLAAGAPFGNDTTRIADLVLPTALWLETGGSYNGARLNPVVEPPGEALSCGELLRRLAGKLDKTLHSETIKPASDEGEPTPGMVELLASHIDEEPLAPQVRSSTVRYGDGSLTDHMGWHSFIEVHGW